MTHQRLTIHPAPFKPSHLSIPPSPFSPLSPLTPVAKPQSQPQPISLSTRSTSTQSAPTKPLQWVWTCHTCHHAYPLGATRRCLDDGHHFCAGTTIVRNWRNNGAKAKIKRHKACASEFDYLGWKGWGRWKRASLVSSLTREVGGPPGGGGKKNCWTQCDYPSQCRWGKRVGIHTPTPTQTAFSFDVAAIDTSVLNSAIDLPSLDDCFVASPPPDVGLEGSGSGNGGAGAFGRAPEASAKRRKSLGSVSPASPLETEFSVQTSEVFNVEMVDAEDTDTSSKTGVVDERCIDPALLALPGVDTSYTSSSSSATARAVEGNNDERERTVDRLKSLLSLSSPRPSRRHIELLPVSNAQRKPRRRHALSALTIQEPLVRSQERLIEGFSPLEGMRRQNGSALNVV